MSARGTARKAAKAIADEGKAVLVQITNGYGDIVTHKAGCRDINRDADRFAFQTGYAKVEAIEDVRNLLEDEMADALLEACRPCCDKAIKAARKAAQRTTKA